MYLAPENSPKSSATPAEVRPDQAILPASGLSDFLAAPQIAWLLNVFPSTVAPYLAAYHAVSNPDALISFLALPDYAALKSLLAIQESAAQQAYLNKILPAPLAVATPPVEDSSPGEQESAQQHQPPETAAMMFPEVHSPAGDGSGGGGSVTVILQSSPQGSPELPGAVAAEHGSSGSMSQLDLPPQAEEIPALSHGDSGFISSADEEASVLEDLGGANLDEAAEEIGAQAEPPVVPENPAVGAAENNLAPGLANLLEHHPEIGGGDAGGSGINGSSGTIFHLQHVAQHGLSNTEFGFAVAGGLGVVAAIVAAVVLSVDSNHQNQGNNGTTASPQTVPNEAPVLSPAVAPSQNAIPLATLWAELAFSGADSGASAGSRQAHDFVASESGIRTSLQNWLSENVPALIVNLAGFDTMSAVTVNGTTTVYVNIELSAKDANAVAGQLAMSDLNTILASLRDYDSYGLRGAAPDWHVQFMGMDVISGEIRQEEAVFTADDGGLASDYFATSNSPVPFSDIASTAAVSDGHTALEINGVQTTLWSI